MLLALDKVLGWDFQRNTTEESRNLGALQSLLKIAGTSAKYLLAFIYKIFKYFKVHVAAL